MSDDMEVARSLLAKIRTFVTTQLTDQESEMFASLLAPAVSLAYTDGTDDVTGFRTPGGGTPAKAEVAAEVEWRPNALASSLSEALREAGVRVVGLDE